MRIAGALTIVIGWIAAAIFLLMPADVALLGSTIPCPTPVLYLVATPDAEVGSPIALECRLRSNDRMLVGGVVWFIANAGGTLMLTVLPRRP